MTAVIDPTLQHRMGYAVILLRGADGKPLANTRLRACQTSHRFLFGCGAFDVLSAVSPASSPEERRTAQERADRWTALYNYGTLPFYWGRYEPEEGHIEEESRRKGSSPLLAYRVRRLAPQIRRRNDTAEAA